jgi:hypothetical protein
MQGAYGTWTSPLPAAAVAAQGLRLGAVAIDGASLYWVEGRPHEAGRNVLVGRGPDGVARDVVPGGFNVRSRVHEYGGLAFTVAAGDIYFSNFSDQRLYRTRIGGVPAAITPAGDWFYADPPSVDKSESAGTSRSAAVKATAMPGARLPRASMADSSADGRRAD